MKEYPLSADRPARARRGLAAALLAAVFLAAQTAVPARAQEDGDEAAEEQTQAEEPAQAGEQQQEAGAGEAAQQHGPAPEASAPSQVQPAQSGRQFRQGIAPIQSGFGRKMVAPVQRTVRPAQQAAPAPSGTPARGTPRPEDERSESDQTGYAPVGTAETGRHTGGAGLQAGVREKAPPPTPSPKEEEDACSGPPLPAGSFTVKNPNGWWPKVSPDGEWVAYGNHAVSVVSVRTRQEKAIKDGCLYPAGWIGRRVLRISSRCDGASYNSAAPSFAAVPTGDDPKLVIAHKEAAADGHWAGDYGGRIVWDGKVLVKSGAGGMTGSMDISDDWLVFPTTNDNKQISIWRGGKLVRDYSQKTDYTELTVTGGYIVYGRYGAPTRGLSPGGQDISVSGGALDWSEALAKVFFVGEKPGRPWVASVLWKDDMGYTLLRPWGANAGIVLNGCAAGMSVVEHCGMAVVARSDDKGKLTVTTFSIKTPRTRISDIVASYEALAAAARKNKAAADKNKGAAGRQSKAPAGGKGAAAGKKGGRGGSK